MIRQASRSTKERSDGENELNEKDAESSAEHSETAKTDIIEITATHGQEDGEGSPGASERASREVYSEITPNRDEVKFFT